MIDWQDFRGIPLHHFIDSVSAEQESLRPFLWTEIFLKEINRNPNQIILHIWPMDNRVILGMLDRQLPHFQKAKSVIESYRYQPVVRNIGGLAVVSDDGILNFSFIIPDHFDDKISITNAYLLMVDFIRAVFSDFYQFIDYYEATESYCPGNYDLSINGKKFAGIAQRRIKKGIVVSIYLSICGDQFERGEMIKNFYQVGLGDTQTKVHYPEVDPNCMSNLDELLDHHFSVDDVIERIFLTLRQFNIEEEAWLPSQEMMSDYQKLLSKSNP